MSPRAARSRWRRWLALAVVAALLLPVLAVLALWPVTPGVGDLEQRIAVRLLEHGARDPGRLPSPDRVGQAVIATEDSRFYGTPGIDPIGVLRAATGWLRGGGDQGGATLEQQLAKVIWTPERHGVAAKAEQVVLALKLDRQYRKDQILEAYLSSVYFGHGYYGVTSAAAGFFGLSPAALSWGQAALIAGLVQAPSVFDPLVHPQLARAKQRHVLQRLVATGVLSQAAADAAAAAPLHLRGG